MDHCLIGCDVGRILVIQDVWILAVKQPTLFPKTGKHGERKERKERQSDEEKKGEDGNEEKKERASIKYVPSRSNPASNLKKGALKYKQVVLSDEE